MTGFEGGEKFAAGQSLRRLAGSALLCSALLLSSPARADLVIPSGGLISLGSGGLDLGCTDLVVGGTLQTNSAPVTNVRHLTIQNGGLLDAGSSSISVGGNWSNSGAFTAGTSQVTFSDICGVGPATISGNTTFYDVSFVSSTGKTWQFASGSTQTVQHLLNIQGTAPNPLQFRSTVPGQMAFIALAGGQTIAHVGVTDVWASGVWLAPYQTNEGGSGNASRWFGEPDYARIPTLSSLGMLVLLLLLSTVIGRTWSRREK